MIFVSGFQVRLAKIGGHLRFLGLLGTLDIVVKPESIAHRAKCV